MATSGTVKTNTTYDSYFWVKWSQKSQNVAANKTTISWSCGVYCGHSFGANAIKWTKALYINGVLVYSGGTYSNYAKGDHTMASGQLDIAHGTDGKKTFNISSFAGWLYSNYTYESSATAYELTSIPRKATITAVADFTDQDNPSFTFSNPGGYTMDVWLEPNPVGDHLCIRNGIPNTGSYTWTLTKEERDQLRNKCSGTQCTIRVGLYTHIGSTTDSDYKDKKFTIVESNDTRPAVALTTSIKDGFEGMYIQGKSRVDITVAGEGKYGATIKDRYVVVEGKTYKSNDFTSDALTGAGEITITGYVVDSRGFTGTAVTKVNVLPYSKPLVVPLDGQNAILCYRSDGNGNRVGRSTSLWIKARKAYHDLGEYNLCFLKWRWKPASRQWADSDIWGDLLGGEDGDEYDWLVDGEFDTKTAYTVQIRAIDYIGEYDIKTLDIPTEDVALHLGKGGKNVTIGEYCDYSEERTFRSAWKAIFDDEVIVQGKTLAEYIKSVMNGG